MYTQTIIASTLLFGATTLAQKTTSAGDPFGKAVDGVTSALDNWGSTETIVPSASLNAQESNFVNYIITGSSISGVPAYVTALPSSLQQGASSAYNDAASVLKTEVAIASSSGIPATSLLAQVTAASSFATSGSPSNSANATTSGAPTSPSSAPSPTKTGNGAEKNGVMMAAGVLAAGLTGVMAML